MPADGPTLRERYVAGLTSGSLAVTLTALVLAIVAGLGTTSFVHEFSVGFLLMLLIGVLLPAAHENQWPQDRGWRRDVAWTVVASALATGAYLGGFLLFGLLFADATYASASAFVAMAVAGAVVLRAVATSRSRE